MVECYTSNRLESRLGMLQEHLVVLAMVLGCDYSLGVHGVGIVNGLEIVQAFAPRPSEDGTDAAQPVQTEEWLQGLRQLRTWSENVANWGSDKAGIEDSDSRYISDFKRSHNNFRTQWSFPEDFPNKDVLNAFFVPEVDRSTEPFSWGSVDAKKVTEQLVEATDETEAKFKERLDPALRRYGDTLRQPRITEYMVPNDGGEVAVVRSIRMREALRGLRRSLKRF